MDHVNREQYPQLPWRGMRIGRDLQVDSALELGSTLWRGLLNHNRRGPWRRRDYDPIVLEICANAISEVYMSLTRGTIQATLVLARYRTLALQRKLDMAHEKNATRPAQRITLRPPTRWLIRRLINEIPVFDRYAARYGRQAALVRFRSRKGDGRA
jgi:hypothetical protein